jgi:hypothetical protein
MTIEIIKKYPLQYKIKCDKCKKEGYVNKRFFDKFGWKHKCLEVTPQETSGRLEIPEPYKESPVPYTVEEISINEDSEVSRAETKVIKKKHNKQKQI